MSQPSRRPQPGAIRPRDPIRGIFALGTIATFRPTGLPIMTGSVLVAITMMLVVIPTAALWAGGGGVLSRFIAGGQANRIVSLGLAALLAATVAYVWI